MNDLTPRDPNAQTTARRRGGAVPDLEQYLDLDRSVTASAIGVTAGPSWPVPRIDDAFSRADAINNVEAHACWLGVQIETALPPDSVQHCRDLAHQAVNAPANRRVVAAAVTLLVGSRARQPEDQQMFMRALEFDLVDLGFSPTVVVVALQRLRREAKFMPEIPEVIVACEAERDRLRAVLDRVKRAARYRVALEKAREEIPVLLAQAEALPEAPDSGLRFGGAPGPSKPAGEAAS